MLKNIEFVQNNYKEVGKKLTFLNIKNKEEIK